MDNKNDFWQTPRGKAALKLIVWAILITVLIVVVLFSNKNTIKEQFNNNDNASTTTKEEPKEEMEFKSLYQMQEDLLNNNSFHVYKIFE